MSAEGRGGEGLLAEGARPILRGVVGVGCRFRDGGVGGGPWSGDLLGHYALRCRRPSLSICGFAVVLNKRGIKRGRKGKGDASAKVRQRAR